MVLQFTAMDVESLVRNGLISTAEGRKALKKLGLL